MKLSSPNKSTFYIALTLGALGILGHFNQLPLVSAGDFWFLTIGFLVLVAGVCLKKL